MLKALAEKASLIYTRMNQIPGIKCNEVQGAMYAYPQVDIPDEALEDAKVFFVHHTGFYTGFPPPPEKTSP